VLVIDFMIWFWGWLNADNIVDLKSMEAALTNQISQYVSDYLVRDKNSDLKFMEAVVTIQI
jgi:hypothetical protein